MKITENQLRKIIKEEVKRTMSLGRVLDRIYDIVGKGESEDYGTTAYIIQKYLELKSTAADDEETVDPTDIEEELTADFRNFKKQPKNPVMVARKLIAAFGLDS